LPRGKKSDITMEIWNPEEVSGEEEKFEQVTIDVKVNSVFSNYHIKPNKMINFPPMLYSESRDSEFEIINNS
jgi:hypothetical protein